MNLLKDAIEEEITTDVRGTKKALKELFSFLKMIPLKAFKTVSKIIFYVFPMIIGCWFLTNIELEIVLGLGGTMVFFVGGLIWLFFWFGVEIKYDKLLKEQKKEILRQEMKEESG